MPLLGRLTSIPGIPGLLAHAGLTQRLMKQAAFRNFHLKAFDDLYNPLDEKELLQVARSESQLRHSALVEDVQTSLKAVQRLMAITKLQVDVHPGFQQSFFSTTRFFPMTRQSRMAKYYEFVGKLTKLPVFAIWGTADTLIPFSLSIHLSRIVPHVEILPVADGGHSIVAENSTAVTHYLLDTVFQ